MRTPDPLADRDRLSQQLRETYATLEREVTAFNILVDSVWDDTITPALEAYNAVVYEAIASYTTEAAADMAPLVLECHPELRLATDDQAAILDVLPDPIP